MTTNEQDLRKQVGIEANAAWPAYAWPGGYPLIYIMDDGGILCAECMNSQADVVHFGGQADGWRVEGVDVYYEGPTLHCDHCGKAIDSAYGDPDQEEVQSVDFGEGNES